MLMLVGCSEYSSINLVDEEEEPTYRRAKQLISRGKNAEALDSLLKLIQGRDGDAPESHLEAGRLYLYHIKDPYSAIYHFNRFKALQTSRANVPSIEQKLSLVEDLKKTAMKEILTSFDAKVYKDPLERLKLLDTIEQLRAENDGIKKALGEARQLLRRSGVEPTRSVAQADASLPSAPESELLNAVEPARLPHRERAAAPNPEPATSPAATLTYYVVKKGDTLASISRKFYGTIARHKDISAANGSVSAQNLQIGTTLVIPE